MMLPTALYQFPKDEYRTPPEQKRRWGDRLSLGTRTYFMAQIIRIFAQSGRDSTGRYNAQLFTRTSHQIMSAIEGCGGRFHIQGIDHVRALDEPAIYACNHMSALENFVLPGLILPFHEVSFVIKASLLQYPIFGNFLKGVNPIALERTNPREDLQKVISEGTDRLKNGYSLIVFPQSTRRDDCPPDSFNSLASKLARKAGVKIVPIAVKTDFWGTGRWLRDFGPLRREKPIHMKFGEPVAVEGNGRQAHKQMVDYITTTFNRWKNQDA